MRKEITQEEKFQHCNVILDALKEMEFSEEENERKAESISSIIKGVLEKGFVTEMEFYHFICVAYELEVDIYVYRKDKTVLPSPSEAWRTE